MDVFAFGMTLFELLSYRPPFGDVLPAVKRNHEIRDKQRPVLKAKETRSLVLLQDLMTMCWDHESDERPRMRQVYEWASAPEFERLRAEINLKDVSSTSCACVCRVSPENEDDYPQCNGSKFNIGHIQDEDVFYDMDESIDYMHDVMMNGIGPAPLIGNSMPSLSQRNILPSVSEDSGNIEHSEGHLPIATPKSVVVADGEDEGEGDVQQELEPYTQIWLCGRDQRKGLLQIFTYYDGQAGSYVCYCHCNRIVLFRHHSYLIVPSPYIGSISGITLCLCAVQNTLT